MAREAKEMCWKNVRDYRNSNEENCVLLLRNIEWQHIDNSLDPDIQRLFFKQEVTNILSIMCPCKKVYTRKHPPLWITPEIYRLIRERKHLYKLYRVTGCYDILKLVYHKGLDLFGTCLGQHWIVSCGSSVSLLCPVAPGFYESFCVDI